MYPKLLECHLRGRQGFAVDFDAALTAVLDRVLLDQLDVSLGDTVRGGCRRKELISTR